MLRPNMNKREKLSKSLRSMFSNLHQHSKKKELSKKKNMTILKRANENSLKPTKLKIKSSRSPMTS